MKRKKELLVVLTSLLVIVLSVTVAYFTVQIIGEGKELSVSTANLQIIYEDTDGSIVGSNIKPPWSSTKTFKVTNSSNGEYEYDIIIEDLVNTFVLDYLEYKITSSNGGYNMTEYKPVPKSAIATDTVLVNKVSIDEGEVHNYTIEFRYQDADVDQSEDMGKTLSGRIMIQEGTELADTGSFMTQLLADNPTVLTRTNFASQFTTDNTGTLYTTTATEDGSTVYYFAGNALNNWVKFGKDKDGNDLYWRIIRTNEDGSIRLLYIGEDKETESAVIASSSYYNNWDEESSLDPMYVGYMYGTSENLLNNRTNQVNSSEIKRIVDNWYASSLNVKTDGTYTYDKYVSKTAIYCNDRSTNGTYSKTEQFDFVGYNESNPSYKCGADANGILFSDASDADKFSVSTARGGNGLLTYPVALMTANELQFAGIADMGVRGSWYTRSLIDSEDFSTFYTMTPGNVEEYDSNILIPSVYTSGEYGNGGYSPTATYLNEEFGVRPVISIKSCANWANGNGSGTSPYELSIDATCASAGN